MPCCRKETKVRPFKADSEESEDFNGPLKKRECRDIIFLIIFLLFIAGLGAVAYLGVQQGNPYRLVYGVDSWGNVCGQKNDKIDNVRLSGEDNTEKTKVFFFDPAYFTSFLPDNPFPQLTEDETQIICIKECPDAEVDVLQHHTDTGINLCIYDVTPYDNDRDKCPVTPVAKHVSVFNRCVPESILDRAKEMTKSFASMLGNVYMGSNLTKKIISDLKNTWVEIGYLAALSVGVALIIVLLMRFLAAIIVWTLVIGVVILSLAGTTYAWYSWYNLDLAYKALPVDQQTSEAQQSVHTWLIYAAIASAIAVIILLILLVLRNRIALVVQLYVEAGRAISCIPFLLLQPVWTLMVLIFFVAALCFLATFIETSGLPVVKPSGHVKYEMERFWWYMRWYNLFAIIWISAFIVACQDLVVAGAVATWYFKRQKKNFGWPILRSIQRLVRYHMGSVAFGSFMIALLRLARLILAYVQKKLQGKVGPVATFIMKCFQCCLMCFEKFLRYLNRNAYIEIAIYGYNFCSSAKKAFMLIVSNCLRVAAINSIGDFVLFLGKLCTVAIILVVGNQFFKGRDDINYIWVPLSVACFFSFCVAHCFLLIYEITIDTIFLCFCEDMERNDGQSKPYFMSKNLRTFIDDSAKAESSNQANSKV